MSGRPRHKSNLKESIMKMILGNIAIADDLKKIIKAPHSLHLLTCWITGTSRDVGTMGGFTCCGHQRWRGGWLVGAWRVKVEVESGV